MLRWQSVVLRWQSVVLRWRSKSPMNCASAQFIILLFCQRLFQCQILFGCIETDEVGWLLFSFIGCLSNLSLLGGGGAPFRDMGLICHKFTISEFLKLFIFIISTI